MPPKKKQSSTQVAVHSESCRICCQSVTVEKDKVLVAASNGSIDIEQALVRSVTELSSRQKAPFSVPPVAVNNKNKQIAKLTDSIESLKMEVTQLKETLASVMAAQATLAKALKRSYVAVHRDSTNKLTQYATILKLLTYLKLQR